ncbi:MAG TPA: SDR family oxidoreductase [Nevskiaceae bacterium]|nr:SDR family oxidoreductase [Nevskiaceae bacterium]
MSDRTALVTGASAGIGKAYAELLAREGYRLILVARRVERLRELADQLAQAHGTQAEVIAADLSQSDAVAILVDEIERRGLTVDYLVNNAGLSNAGAFTDHPWETLAAEIQVMITAVTELAHRLAPGMKARGWGRIVNVSSVAAFAPTGKSMLYTGIKSYVLLMSQALDMELKPSGVHVSALCPGFTRTEFHDVMGTRELATKNLPGPLWSSAESVVKAGHAAVMRGEPVCIPGWINKAMAASARRMPLWLGYRLGRDANPLE